MPINNIALADPSLIDVSSPQQSASCSDCRVTWPLAAVLIAKINDLQ